MITVRIIEYWNDYRKREKWERFDDLDGLADWIFYQMQVDYSSKDGWLSLSFPKCETADKIHEITVRPERGGSTLWIKQIEDDYRGIVFSDGTFTAGRKHCTKEVRQWLARCEQRKQKPTFHFAPDAPEAGISLVEETVQRDIMKRAAYRIHMAGGCDASDEYGMGYDDAITVALDILLEETGFGMDDILDYGESGGMMR